MRRSFLILTAISFSALSQPAQQAQPPLVVQVQMPPTPRKGSLDYFQEFGPLLAAVAAVTVAVMQWYLQKQHLKQNLFDKRYSIYAAVDAFLTNVLNANGAMDEHAVNTFRLETAHAEFLFGKDVTDFLGLIHSKAMDLAIVKAQIDRSVEAHRRFQGGESDSAPMEEALAELLESHTDLIMWIAAAQQERNNVFRSLQLHHERPWYSRLKAKLDHWMDSADVIMSARSDHQQQP
jgi:nicotinamide riboside kinase